MISKRVGLWLLLALLAPVPALPRDAVSPPASVQIDAKKLAAIPEWLKADVERGRIPGAVVLVARDGKVAMIEAVGWADKDRGVKMTTDSIRPSPLRPSSSRPLRRSGCSRRTRSGSWRRSPPTSLSSRT